MAKVLKADCTGTTVSTVSKDLGTLSECYLTFTVAFAPAALTFWTNGFDLSGDFGVIEDLVSFQKLESIFIYQASGFSESNPPFNDSTIAPIANTWQTIELHFKSGVVGEAWVDGVQAWTSAAGSGAITSVTVGQSVSSAPNAAGIAYIGYVKVGSTRGAADIFSEDFASGLLSVWDSVDGTVSVVDDPFGGDTDFPAVLTSTPSADWRWDLCDRYGVVIQTLDPYVMGREMIFDLNRPCSVAGRVASNNAVINATYVDGFPYLSPGNRTLKCWRYEGGSWVLRFAGIVWQVSDEGDTDTSYTSFTAFDPWQFLFRRMIRRNDGNLKKTVHLANNAAAAVKRHLEKTIEYAGACYIDPDDVDAYFQPLLVYLTMEYEQEYLGRAFIDVTDTGVVDVRLNPVDRTDGILCIPTAVETYGSDKTLITFQYDIGDRVAMGWERTLDMDQVANSITNFTGKKKAAPVFVEDSDSQLTYGVMEDAKVFTEIQHTDALTALSNMELAERKDPRELIQAVPLPETGAVVFEDYFLGDTVTVETSNSAREAVSGIQRIYGFTLDIDDEGVERITELRVSPVLGG
jgi:hypothetical protein